MKVLKISPTASLLSAMLILTSCAVTSITPGEGFEADIDFSKLGMRHGWSVFLVPEDTIARTSDTNSLTRGQQIYQKHCQACHGPKGMGDGPLARERGLKPANLKNLSRNVENYFLVFQIDNGKQDMPQWKDILSATETSDVTAYIQNLGDQQK